MSISILIITLLVDLSIFISFALYWEIKYWRMKLCNKFPFQISYLLITKTVHETEAFLRQAGVTELERHGDDRALFHYSYGKQLYEGVIDFADNKCKHVKIVTKTMIVHDIFKRMPSIFSEVSKKVNRKGYMECYEFIIVPNKCNKLKTEIIQYWGIDNDRCFTIETFDAESN